MRPGHLIATFAVLVPLAMPAGAMANEFQEIFGDYRADGQLNGCYSPQQLQNAAGQIPPDVEQYAPGFGNALAGAQSGCRSAPAPTTTEEAEEAPAPVTAAGTPSAPTPGPVTKKAVTEPPAPKKEPKLVVGDLPDPRLNTSTVAVSTDTPGALIALVIAAGIVLALALAWTLAWFLGWNPERLTRPLSATFQTVWDRLIAGR